MDTIVIFKAESAEIGRVRINLTFSALTSEYAIEGFVLEGRSPKEFGENIVFSFRSMRLAKWDWVPDPTTLTVFGGLFATCMIRKLNGMIGDAIEECLQKPSKNEVVTCLLEKAPQFKAKIIRAAYDCGTSIVGGQNP